jgi:hypothetical protein
VPQQDQSHVDGRKENTISEPDHWLNPYRHPSSKRGWDLIHAVLHGLKQREQRKRARKSEHQRWFWETVTALVSDLTHHYLSGSPGAGLVVTRTKNSLAANVLGKASRYTPPIYTQSFPKLLDAMELVGYLQQRKGSFSGMPGQSKATTIRAGSALVELIDEHEVTFADFTVSGDEIIILKERKRNFRQERTKRLEYKDTTETKRLRAQVARLNAWLAKAELQFDPGAYELPVDPTERRLYRYFAGDFQSGGRLFKGFWENLPKEVRRDGIRIEGERVAVLDYSQLNPTLAYWMAEATPPPGDAYTLKGLEHYRDGVKQMFNAMLFDTHNLRDSAGRTKFPDDVKQNFGPKTRAKDVVAAIHQKHPKLASVLSSGVGLWLMFHESEIMMRVLERLQEREIVALPVFDAVVVKVSSASDAKAVMAEEFKQYTGRSVVVTIE